MPKKKNIIRAKTNNVSARIIAADMKVSIRTVNRVWEHWMKKQGNIDTKEIRTPQDQSQRIKVNP